MMITSTINTHHFDRQIQNIVNNVKGFLSQNSAIDIMRECLDVFDGLSFTSATSVGETLIDMISEVPAFYDTVELHRELRDANTTAILLVVHHKASDTILNVPVTEFDLKMSCVFLKSVSRNYKHEWYENSMMSHVLYKVGSMVNSIHIFNAANEDVEIIAALPL